MSNKQHIRLALVGCGRQMEENLLPFLQRIPGLRVVVCVDEDETRAKKMAEIARARFWRTDIREVDCDEIGGAIVAVPPEPSSHVTRHLVRAGVPCFVEKPAGPSTSTLEIMAREARQSGSYVQVGFNFRYAETVSYLHEVSRERREHPHALTIDFLSKHPSLPQWGCDNTIEAWIRQNGIHAIDLAHWFAASPVTDVTAHLIETDEHRFLCTVLLRHASRSISILRIGNQTRKFIIRIGLHCIDSSRYSMPSLEKVKLDLDEGLPSGTCLFATRNLDHGWARSGFGPELQRFSEHLFTRGKAYSPWPSLEDAYRASQTADRVIEGLGLGFIPRLLESSADESIRQYTNG